MLFLSWWIVRTSCRSSTTATSAPGWPCHIPCDSGQTGDCDVVVYSSQTAAELRDLQSANTSNVCSSVREVVRLKLSTWFERRACWFVCYMFMKHDCWCYYKCWGKIIKICCCSSVVGKSRYLSNLRYLAQKSSAWISNHLTCKSQNQIPNLHNSKSLCDTVTLSMQSVHWAYQTAVSSG